MRLFRVEVRRLAARRFCRVALVVLFGGLGVVLAATATDSHRPSTADLAEAQQRAATAATAVAADRRRCEDAKTAQPSDGFDCRQIEAPPPESFLSVSAFNFRAEITNRTVALSVALALFAFILGATAVGAEWAHGTMAGLLLWEPRRTRVFLAKFAALLGGLGLISIVAYAVHLVGHYSIADVRGEVGELSSGFDTSLGLLAGRGLAVVGVAAACGFAIAYTLRHTAAALGLALGYLVVAEVGLRLWSVRWSPYLLSTNLDAWLNRGTVVPVYSCDAGGVCTASEIKVSMAQGGLVLLGVALVLLIGAALVFRRREVT